LNETPKNCKENEFKKRCHTCKKKRANGTCHALTAMIGLVGDCWAWTDDPDWYEKYRQASENYSKWKKFKAED